MEGAGWMKTCVRGAGWMEMCMKEQVGWDWCDDL